MLAIAIVFGIIAIAVWGGSVEALRSYRSSLNPGFDWSCSRTSDETKDQPQPDIFFVNGTVISVDAENQEARLRLDFTPPTDPKYTISTPNGSAQNVVLAAPVTVVLGGIVPDPQRTGDPSSYSFAAGEVMSPIDVTVELSQTGSYLWDSYNNNSNLFIVGATSKTDGHYVDTIVAPGNASALPVCVTLSSTVGGWKVSPSAVYSTPTHPAALNLDIRRSDPVKFYAWFVLILMGSLTLAGVALAVILVTREREHINSADLAYFAALLFAYPLIRQTLPGDPALGVKLDYLSFFWAEAIVAATLLTVLTTWIVHKAKGHSQAQPRGEGSAGTDVEPPSRAASPPVADPPSPAPTPGAS